MFDIKYNLINLLKVTVSTLSMILMLRLLGFSQDTDIYLLAYSIILSWHYIPTLFIGQFIQFYNDLKISSIKYAHKFYNQTLLLTLGIGILLFLVCFIFLDFILHIYTVNIDSYRLILLKQTVRIMLFSNIFAPFVAFYERVFIAETKYAEVYILHIIIILLPVITMFYLLATNNPNINILAISYVLAVAISALFGIVYSSFKLIPLRPYFKLKNYGKFISNSFTMSLGNAIYFFSFPIVLNNFLIHFSNGIISYFYYSKNAIEAVNMIATDYSNINITSELSKSIAQKNTNNIKVLTKKYIKIAPLLFGAVSVLIYLMIPFVLKIVFYKTGITFDAKTFSNIFISLVPWYLIFVFTNPFCYINTLGKKSFNVIFINTIFIGTVVLILSLLGKNIYNISIAIAIAQLIVFILYLYYACKFLRTIEKDLQ